ncbi:2-succinyl-5-enolpyruvyl-6-hydroxy-3-cyclohexene-1-carboxylic-acid synthase [Jiangella aurantiaca]|uniref:2-succinyl-5-enolpyruvyl-6-hydroxy-3-cyclohexene-1-carboxylate synthase n=1 Tax=Jiangella aurantiaca TaxID=2530373 RepID=A0A4R5ADT2_9ACTN|nr:2-succinyl-5-enolpyruvyl-6-hydroxy-3-cyclohexene-1-carboxylic-acid synthase [Jiangella aurantiaca]TDD69426.1 2-succinyl-5-enolpyruvyl-6-hydroxy-3-cyclohexene-1-carboxylic-acid synthase [Jiangella aurantiaca]
MNPSTSAARTLVTELVRYGVRHVVLAPGSRSAPLAHALATAAARGDLRLHVRIDERVAAFTALGLARVAGPVAVVTTSGTAAANLYPAVLEASHSGVPLLLLTADRPHEVRGTGANQTTDQVRLFGSAVRFFADVPAPYGRPGEDADLRALLARAVAAAVGTRSGFAGPVHLDLAFREPLVPDDDAAWPVSRAGAVDVTDVTAVAAGAGAAPAGEPVTLDEGPRTVAVAGDAAGPAARTYAEAAGLPLLAEPSSGARSGPNAVGPYRLLLERPELGGRVERVVVFGHATLSRPVSALLAGESAEVVVVAGGAPDWIDPGRRAARVVPAVTVPAGAPGGDGEWLASWQRAAKAAQDAVDGVLAAGPLSGPAVAALVWAARRPGETLVAGSSNPIRDLDLAAAPLSATDGGPVLANRGLAGIDGTLSTATGVALGTGLPVRALVGDLTFLHDAGGLLIGPLEDRSDLQIVVVNDDGGGIFALLEHGDPAHADRFERVFGTPHGADLASLCAGYGVAHRRVTDGASLRAALAEPVTGRSVLEVPVARAALRDLHARIRAAVTAALG